MTLMLALFLLKQTGIRHADPLPYPSNIGGPWLSNIIYCMLHIFYPIQALKYLSGWNTVLGVLDHQCLKERLLV